MSRAAVLRGREHRSGKVRHCTPSPGREAPVAAESVAGSMQVVESRGSRCGNMLGFRAAGDRIDDRKTPFAWSCERSSTCLSAGSSPWLSLAFSRGLLPPFLLRLLLAFCTAFPRDLPYGVHRFPAVQRHGFGTDAAWPGATSSTRSLAKIQGGERIESAANPRDGGMRIHRGMGGGAER